MFFFEEEIIDLNINKSMPKELEEFYKQNKLDMHEGLDKVILYRDNGNIIASGGYKGFVIKGLAIDEEYQGYNLTGKVISRLLEILKNNGINHVFLFTKPENTTIFKDLGFNLLIKSKSAVLFERGYPDIKSFKSKLENSIKDYDFNSAGAIIVNCNPMTLGHLYLIEYASSKVDLLHIFVLEEDRSLFPFEVRFNLVKENTKHLDNIVVHKSSKYIISSATFPDYFLKGLDKSKVHSELDIRMFGKHIGKTLKLDKRFVGEEPYCEVTLSYNENMEKILPEYGINLEIIPRKQHNGEAISASRVRKLIKEDKFDEIKLIVPNATYNYLKSENSQEIIRKIKKSNSRH